MGDLAKFFLQLFGIVVGAFIIVYQLGRQHRSTLELQKENLKDELRINLFNRITESIAEAEAGIGDVHLWGSFVPSALRTFLRHSEIPKFRPPPIKYRSSELVERQRRASRAITAVISTIECREVIAPVFVVFRYAIFQQSKHCDEAFRAFHLAVLPFLPVDPPTDLANAGALPQALRSPSSAEIHTLEEIGHRLQSEYATLSSYLSDLSREAQNRLLGSVFGQEVHPRMPLDSAALVISSDRDALLRIEEQLQLTQHLHPEALPSRVLFPQKDEKPNHRWFSPRRK